MRRLLFLAMIVLLAATPPTLAQTEAKRAGELLEGAQKDLEAGRVDEARGRLLRVIEIGGSRRQQADAHVGLALIAQRLGDLPESASRFQEALRLIPTHRQALRGLAGLMGQSGSYTEAASTYGLILQQAPDDVSARLGQVTALIFAGEHRQALASIEAGLEASPESLDLKDVLARHLAGCPDLEVRDGDRALTLALEVARQVPTPQSLETLAMAYAETGRFEQAVEEQDRLLEAYGDKAGSELVAQWRRNRELYSAGKRCCADSS
ncbi:MAG: tetratricopeptide repeat protein [Acidobacteriota bacterium]